MRILLENYQSYDYITGRNKGKDYRKKLNLDSLEDDFPIICVDVPKDTIGINISFMLGLFGKSIRKYGRTKFLEKYKFNYPNSQVEKLVEIDLEKAIKEALDKRNARNILGLLFKDSKWLD